MLSGLTIGSLLLNPTFAPDVESYTLETSNNRNKITALCADDGAEIAVSLTNRDGASTVNNGTAAAWAVGENKLTVVVSKNGAKSVYTVNVTKT